MQDHVFDCFGEGQGGGNPALVIEDGPLDAAARGALARERALTCVFLDRADETGVAAVVDFVYPHTRSPLCLHATLAAACLLFARQDAYAPLTLKTAMRGQHLQLSRQDETLFVGLARQDVPPLAVDEELAMRLLAAPALTLASAPRIASVGSPKLLLEVANPDTLHGLAPDLHAIAAWGRETGVNGCYVWCRTGEAEYEGRNFNHLDPRLEDAATGVAAGALTALLGHGLALRQGRAVGRACLMHTRHEGERILVGGRVAARQW